MTLPRKSAFLCEGRYLIANTRVLVRRQLLDRRKKRVLVRRQLLDRRTRTYSYEGSYSIGENGRTRMKAATRSAKKARSRAKADTRTAKKARSRAKMGTR